MDINVNDLLAKLKAMDTRHKISLAIIVVVAIMVIIAVFFIKSSFGKISVDRSEIEAIQKERDSLKLERAALHQEIQYFHDEIAQRGSADSAIIYAIDRQNASLSNINNKISILNNAKKKPADYSNISSDSLERFFSGLSH
jgi:cell division protein FtsB